MVDTVHDQKIAKTYAGLIRSAKQGRRRAFAFGQLGNFPVMAVGKGKPATVASTLKKMVFESGKAPPGMAPKAQVRPVTHGLLYLDERTLVLQCRVKPPATVNQSLKKYFHFLKAPVRWGPVKIVRLSEDDDGDVDDGSPDAEVADDSGSDVPVDTADDDAIEDAWSDDTEATPIASATPPADDPAAEQPDNTPSDSPDAGEAAARRAADAKTLTEHAVRMAPFLRNQRDSSPEDLQQTFEAMLESVSPERLLLALSYSDNIAHLQDLVAQSPKEPIQHDEAGIATIASALARMGAKLGRERRIVGAHEAVDPGRLEAMVRKDWDGKPNATPQQIIRELSTVLSQTFATVPPARSRALLGLQGSQPAQVEERPQDETPDQASGSRSGEGSAIRGKLERARRAWDEGKSLAIAGIEQLKSELVREYGEDEDEADVLAESLRRLEGVKAQLNEPLDSVLSEAEPERHPEPLPPVLAAVVQMETFISQDELMVQLAGTEYLPQVIIIPPLQEALMEVRAALSA